MSSPSNPLRLLSNTADGDPRSFYTPEPNLVPGYIEEGEIWMSMGYYFNGTEKAMACRDAYDGYDVDYSTCFDGLTAAIDKYRPLSCPRAVAGN